MAPQRPFHALSLDFWFTSIYYAPGSDNRWREDRIRILGQVLVSKTGEELPPPRIEEAVAAVHTQLRARDLEPGVVNPQELVSAYSAELDAHLVVPLASAARALSSAGLHEHPPLVNTELNGLIRAMAARNVPVIAITNTARREESWQEFFTPRTDAPFRHIVTSCEVGHAKPSPTIFIEASRRLGIPPSRILHVGDRWELDVAGAQQAGFGAVLYRGLWSHYPAGMDSDADFGPPDDLDVPSIDRLDQLLEGDLLEAGPLPSTPTAATTKK